MAAPFTSLETCDVRFPTSRGRAGSGALSPDPDYSADDPGGRRGHGAPPIGLNNRVLACVDHLREQFADPGRIERATAWREIETQPDVMTAPLAVNAG